MSRLNFLQAHTLIDRSNEPNCNRLDDGTRSRIIRLSQLDSEVLPIITRLVVKNPTLAVAEILRTAQKNGIQLSGNYPASLIAKPLTPAEERMLDALRNCHGAVCSRDCLAQALWGKEWIDKYSEWDINTIIHHLRGKLRYPWNITAIRSRGYRLLRTVSARISIPDQKPVIRTSGKYPPISYLRYMNSPANARKTLFDLFGALHNEGWDKPVMDTLSKTPTPSILIVNSYSYDNVDAVHRWLNIRKIKARVYFSHFDERALEIHRNRIARIGLKGYFALFDDIRSSRITGGSMHFVINDFRLNFNTDDRQNRAMLSGMHAVTDKGGLALVSAVIDPRYEHPRYGSDQELAPLHIHAPGTFEAAERFPRPCWTVPYYLRNFKLTKWQVVSGFDAAAGRHWADTFTATDPLSRPYYRRWILKK